MKYKFSIPSRLKGFIEWQLEHYPEDKREIEQYKKEMVPSPVQQYSLTGGVSGGETHRATEDVAMRIATSQYIKHLEASCKAVEEAMKGEDDTSKKLVELIYWKREYTPEGAGMKIGLQKSAVYQRLNKILGRIAFEMGYVSI